MNISFYCYFDRYQKSDINDVHAISRASHLAAFFNKITIRLSFPW